MKKFDKNLVLSAVKDAFFTDSYDEYSIGHGWTMYRNDDVECWEDEGFTICEDDKDIFCTYCIESFCKGEEEWFFNKGEVIERMVDYIYEEKLSFIEDYEFVAESYSPEELVYALKNDEMTKEEVVDAVLDEVSNILTDWSEGGYLEEDWWDVAVPVLKEYFNIANNECGTKLPYWIRRDIMNIQFNFSSEKEFNAWEGQM